MQVTFGEVHEVFDEAKGARKKTDPTRRESDGDRERRHRYESCNLTQINGRTICLDLITMEKRDVKNLVVPIPRHIPTKRVMKSETEGMIGIMNPEIETGDRVIVAAVTLRRAENMNTGSMVMIGMIGRSYRR